MALGRLHALGGFRHALEPEAALEDSPFVARTFVQMLSPDHNAEEAE